jgi:hypothetical protein
MNRLPGLSAGSPNPSPIHKHTHGKHLTVTAPEVSSAPACAAGVSHHATAQTMFARGRRTMHRPTIPFPSDLIPTLPCLSFVRDQATAVTRSAPDDRVQRSVVSTKSARESAPHHQITPEQSNSDSALAGSIGARRGVGDAVMVVTRTSERRTMVPHHLRL